MNAPIPTNKQYRFPAEWEPHRATWIAWPVREDDWPGKLAAIPWVYVEIARHLARSEVVEILCCSDEVLEEARAAFEISGLEKLLVEGRVRLHRGAYDRTWLRDSAPTFVKRGADPAPIGIEWSFNAWAKYDDYQVDRTVPRSIEAVTGHGRVEAFRPGSKERFVLEGGAIDSDGQGTLLTSEECLLDTEVQVRNPGMSREDYEEAFRTYLGITRTIWLGKGCEGDDTHGHIDDIARFVAPGKVALAYEEDPADPNHESSVDNLARLRAAKDAAGNSIEVVTIPMPDPLWYEGVRLPASYANFYIGNSVVLVPTFNDPKDSVALETLRGIFPGRRVVGIHAVDLVLGYGTLHCLSQQEPA